MLSSRPTAESRSRIECSIESCSRWISLVNISMAARAARQIGLQKRIFNLFLARVAIAIGIEQRERALGVLCRREVPPDIAREDDVAIVLYEREEEAARELSQAYERHGPGPIAKNVVPPANA
jgi:hypothetical protein